MKSSDVVRFIIFICFIGLIILMGNYQMMYHEVLKKCYKNVISKTDIKTRYIQRFRAGRRKYLITYIFLINIVNMPIIDTSMDDFAIGWLFSVVLILINLHPKFHKFLPKIISGANEGAIINFLYDTDIVPYILEIFSFFLFFISAIIMIYVYYYSS